MQEIFKADYQISSSKEPLHPGTFDFILELCDKLDKAEITKDNWQNYMEITAPDRTIDLKLSKMLPEMFERYCDMSTFAGPPDPTKDDSEDEDEDEDAIEEVDENNEPVKTVAESKAKKEKKILSDFEILFFDILNCVDFLECDNGQLSEEEGEGHGPYIIELLCAHCAVAVKGARIIE